MIIAKKIEKRNCGYDTFLSGKQAVQRAWALEHFQVKWTRFTVENAAKTKTRADSTQVKTALAFATSLLLSFTCAAPAVAGNLESKETSGTTKRKSNSILEILPTTIDGYTIGNPSKRNNYPGVYSGVDDPDATPPAKKKFVISRSAKKNGDITVFTTWKGAPNSKQERYVNRYYSLMVIFFMNSKEKPYIYGTILDGRALTNGIPILTDGDDWDCQLFN